MTVRARSRCWFDGTLLALFLAALAAPWFDEQIRPDAARTPENNELRAAAQEPKLAFTLESLWRFPEAYQAWFNDFFGLRDKLLRWNSIVKLYGFHTSPANNVLLGKDGWMFFTGDHSMQVWRGLLPFEQNDLEAWRELLELRRDWCAARGLTYLFVIAPNKEAIYPDYLPASMNQVGPTRHDQLTRYLQQFPAIPFLDLRPAFLASRKNDATQGFSYFPEGTHWDGHGGWVAYNAILERLAPGFPALKPYPLERWSIVPVPGHGDSWSRNMYIEDLSGQSELSWQPKEGLPSARIVAEGRWGPLRKRITEVDDPALPRAVFFHDSFGPYVEHMFMEHFSHLCCMWRCDFDAAEIEPERPQIVIDMFVERSLVNFDPRTLAPKAGDLNQRRFEAAQDVRFVFDPKADPPELEAQAGTQLAGLSDGHGPALSITSTSMGDTVLLPEFPFSGDRDFVVYIDIESAVATVADLFYLHPGETEYARRNNLNVALSAGRTRAYFVLPNEPLAGRLRLRLRPEGTERTYVLRAFEVRAVARQ